MANSESILDRRRAGVLLAVNALPGPEDHGDFSQAYRFIEFLHSAGISIWQLLPMGPTHINDCPYQCLSAHAGEPMLIGLNALSEQGLLSKSDLGIAVTQSVRKELLQKAHENFANEPRFQPKLSEFVASHQSWLPDFALFSALRDEQQQYPWVEWDAPLRDRAAGALDAARGRLENEIRQVVFEQFVFAQQWQSIRAFAHTKGVKLLGDMPLFVAHDSADVWTNRSDFQLGSDGLPSVVAGVPPDYFSADGQRWDNPIFAWDYQQQQGFHWWVKRMQSELEHFDMLRFDHFRGLVASWAIPAAAESARDGYWQDVPGAHLLNTIHDALQAPDQPLPIIAEDLGMITAEVHQLREQFAIPGMRVLQFAFDGSEDNPHLPANHIENCVLYTGTHDNNTSLGWYQSLDDETRRRVDRIVSDAITSDDPHTAPPLNPEQWQMAPMPWPLIECAFQSPARYTIIPMQDLLGLGAEHRTNTPGTVGDNWRWRFEWSQVSEQLTETVRDLIAATTRL